MNWKRITISTAALAAATAAMCVPAFGQVTILDPISGDDADVPVTIGTIVVKGNTDATGNKVVTVPGEGEGSASVGPSPGLGSVLKVSCIGGVLGGGSANAGLAANLGECNSGGGPGDDSPGNDDGDDGNGGNDDTVVPGLPDLPRCIGVATSPSIALDLTCEGGNGAGTTGPNNTGNDDTAGGAGSTGALGGGGDGDGSATSCVPIDEAANISGTSGKGPLLGGLALGLTMFALGALSRRRRAGSTEAV